MVIREEKNALQHGAEGPQLEGEKRGRSSLVPLPENANKHTASRSNFSSAKEKIGDGGPKGKKNIPWSTRKGEKEYRFTHSLDLRTKKGKSVASRLVKSVSSV